MTKYHCECCNFTSFLKSNYERHLKTKKHEKRNICHHKVTNLSPIVTNFVTTKSPFLTPIVTTKNEKRIKIGEKRIKIDEKGIKIDEKGINSEKKGINSEKKGINLEKKGINNEKRIKKNKKGIKKNKKEINNEKEINNNKFTCKYCSSVFKFRQGMYRHLKYYCKKNEDEDLKELVKLMNEQLTDIKKEVDNSKKEIEKKDKMIQKLSTKLQITNYNNTNCVVNNIQLLNYHDTDISHLTKGDYEKALNQVNNAIPSIVKKIHFNPNKPENMNVYIPNIKDKYILIFNGGEWQLKNRSKELNNLIDDKYRLLKEWYDENIAEDEDTFLFIKNNFEQFDQNIENEQKRNEIKEEIIMFMYNRRNLIIKNSQDKNIHLLEN